MEPEPTPPQKDPPVDQNPNDGASAHEEEFSGPALPTLSADDQKAYDAYVESVSKTLAAGDAATVAPSADEESTFKEYAAAAEAAIRNLKADDKTADDIAAGRERDFKPHQISSAKYKFTSGGAFRTTPSEIAIAMKDRCASAVKYSQQDIDPDTPCKACGEKLGRTSSRFNYGGNTCSNCGAKFHKCANGEIKYGSFEFFECPECKKLPRTCSLPSAYYSDMEAEEANMVVNCPMCDMRFKAEPRDGPCPGCGSRYFFCKHGKIHWGPVGTKCDCAQPVLMRMGSLEPTEHQCPCCGHQDDPLSHITANDGGSNVCGKCGTIYHYHCTADGKKGIAQIGSPGPTLCAVCASAITTGHTDDEITPVQFMKPATVQVAEGAFVEPQIAKMTRPNACLLCKGVLVGLASWDMKDIATRRMARSDPPEFKYCASCKIAFCLDANNIPIKGVVLP